MSTPKRIQPLFQLEGKVALITGASKGIGEAIARGLAEFGAKVVISSRKQQAVDAVAVQPIRVRAEVAARRREDQRIFAEHLQIKGNVPRRATKMRLQARDVERNVQRVELVGENVVLEMVREDHDVIERNGSGHVDRHVSSRARSLAASAPSVNASRC